MITNPRLHARTMGRFGKTAKQKAEACINDCFRPSAEASPADLREFHAENMRLRRVNRRKVQPGFRGMGWGRNYQNEARAYAAARMPDYQGD